MSPRPNRGLALSFVIALALVLGGYGLLATQAGNRVTILYDAFGKSSAMTKDWGYSALVEYGGKRILFDTGNNPRIFARNVEAAGVDLTRLDFVVISHRHGDHTTGLSTVIQRNPGVKIFTPQEGAFFKGRVEMTGEKSRETRRSKGPGEGNQKAQSETGKS